MADLELETKLANLSVCEDKSPLKAIPPDSPRVTGANHVKPGCPPNKSLPQSGSQSDSGKGTKEDQVRFNKLVKKAKHLAQEGQVQQALELNKEALQIHYHEKLARRIAKMEAYLKNYGNKEEEEEEEMESGMVQVGSGFYMYKDLYSKLYNHQKQGVLWMWGLHKKNKGGILGDDMGLGKTIQVIGFLSGMFDMDKVSNVLIVLPVSVMVNWEKEFSKWAPGISVYSYHGTSKRERERALVRVQRRGGVLLTTYGMVLTNHEQLSQRDGSDFVWDYVILDEGHKIKNPSKTTKAIHSVAATHRIILTGTPIQNNLKELWTLFDYVQQGSLLGTLRTFKMEFENPIIRARERDSTAGEKRLGLEMAQSLKKIIDPYFLRRTKAEVKEQEKKAGIDCQPQKSIKMPTMTFKNDFVVWLFLSDTQLNIYRDFLELSAVKELLMSSKSPLVALTVLKKICDHPRLLSLRACHQLGLHGQGIQNDELELPSSLESAVTKIETLQDSVLIGEAGKMNVLVPLVDRLREEGHRTLIFSQSRKILDIIQKVLKNRGHKVMRLDGTVKSVVERDELVRKFQQNTSISVFLLTTQVGGVGLTLTAADRVIIYDPSWNPATDAQAVDRAFRIGQTRNVVIYRLITCGTVEEKIYRRQIFKDSITRQTTGNAKDPYRYFTKQELRELFQLEEPRVSNTQLQLEQMHGLDRRRDPDLDDHIAYLHSLDIFGISDHDLMFSQESPEEDLQEMVPTADMPPVNAHHQDYIRHRVQKAKEIIERESSIPGTMEQRMKSSHPTTSVYSAPEHRSLMGGVPTFHPTPADSNHLALNRPGGGVTVFQPKPSDSNRYMLNRPAGNGAAKGPQVIMVYPPKPITMDKKPGAKADVSSDISIRSGGSSSSDLIDLTGDDGEEEDNVTLPTMEKKNRQNTRAAPEHPGQKESTTKPQVKQESSPASRVPLVSPVATAEAEHLKEENVSASDDHLKEEDVSPKTQAEESKAQVRTSEMPGDTAAESNLPAMVPASPKISKQKPHAPMCSTPQARSQRVIEEELIISPKAYTPLMMTRQKRRRLTDSPLNNLEKALSDALLVTDSPDLVPASPTTSTHLSSSDEKQSEEMDKTQKEIASFLAEDDPVVIEESFVEGPLDSLADADHEASSVEGSGLNHSEKSGSSEEMVVVQTKRRRSVCRRVAVIESSEDEMEDEENKENLHPSLSRSDCCDDEKEEDASDKENRDTRGADDEVTEDESDAAEDEEADGELVTEEESEKNEDETEEEESEENGSVTVYDESMTEEGHKDGDQEEEDGQEYGEEEHEEEDGEEEVDVELLNELLKAGKKLYKQKQYPEALEKCQAALAIVYDPELQAVIDKIERKIQQGS